MVIHPLHTYGGAELHLKVVSDKYPDAIIMTAWADMKLAQKLFPGRTIKTTWFDKLPIFVKRHPIWIPLQGFLYKHMDISSYDKVFILSDGFEKQVLRGIRESARKPYTVLHIMTPPRFLWMKTRSMRHSSNLLYRIYKSALSRFLHPGWRRQDREAVTLADKVYANSDAVQIRIEKFYGVESTVLYPPVNFEEVSIDRRPERFYLYFGRLESYKGVELAIRACIILGRKLYIAGTGGDEDRLRKIVKLHKAGKLIKFLGFVSDNTKKSLFARCTALLYPVRDEDFGLVPVEANYAGVPVIAYKGGGVAETIADGRSGVFFDEYTATAMAEAIRLFEEKLSTDITPESCRQNAVRFDKRVFLDKLEF